MVENEGDGSDKENKGTSSLLASLAGLSEVARLTGDRMDRSSGRPDWDQIIFDRLFRSKRSYGPDRIK